MKIHQIQMRYDELQDRILLRLSTTDNCEFRFWLTRRFVKRLWGMLVKMLEWDRAVQQQLDMNVRRTVLDIQHEGFVHQGDFCKRFEEAPRRAPLGDQPVVLSRAKGEKGDEGMQVLSLHPQQGQGIDLTVDAKLLHLFVKILREAVARTDWEIPLALHEEGEQTATAEAVSPRKLN